MLFYFWAMLFLATVLVPIKIEKFNGCLYELWVISSLHLHDVENDFEFILLP